MKFLNSVLIASVASMLAISYALEHKDKLENLHHKLHHNK